MTYNVFGGTLNLAQSMTYNVLQLIPQCHTQIDLRYRQS